MTRQYRISPDAMPALQFTGLLTHKTPGTQVDLIQERDDMHIRHGIEIGKQERAEGLALIDVYGRLELVRSYMEQGNKIGAIKEFRALCQSFPASNMGLREAKEWVEMMYATRDPSDEQTPKKADTGAEYITFYRGEHQDGFRAIFAAGGDDMARRADAMSDLEHETRMNGNFAEGYVVKVVAKTRKVTRFDIEDLER